MKVKTSKAVYQCLPNMFCIKNTTILLIVILSIVGIYFVYSKYASIEQNIPNMNKISKIVSSSSLLFPSLLWVW